MSAVMQAGVLASVHRYPVKSMMGEELNAARITPRGLFGDRAYALCDAQTHKIVSAKNPRKWPLMFSYRAAYVSPPEGEAALPAVRVTLPDGTFAVSSSPEFAEAVSSALGRPVTLLTSAPPEAQLEEYWPDMEGLANRDLVTDEAMPPGTFFDLAVLHLLSTATLDQLRELYPAGRFEPRRFRPNLIVSTPGQKGFVENDWIGKTLAIGPSVKIKVTGPCPRCVMTTLAQGDLPKDPAILKTAAQHNEVRVGIYASVIQTGTVHVGDAIHIEQRRGYNAVMETRDASMPHLAKIHIFPVKSLDPIAPPSARVLKSGALEGDRSFAMFDAAGKYVNGKRQPRIHGLRTRLDAVTRTLHLTAADGVERAWNVDGDRDKLEEWLGEYFGFAVTFKENGEAGFPDDTDSPGPTVISTATLQEVMSWYPGLNLAQVRLRFRANLEIGGVPAFWEDHLFTVAPGRVRFQIGEVLMDGNNPCRRCIVPTRDPLTGQQYADFNKTLMARRQEMLPAWAERSRFDHFHRLAVNTVVAVSEAGKSVCVGDEVRIIGPVP